MNVTEKTWEKYLSRLRRLNDRAAQLVARYLAEHTIETYDERQVLIEFANAIVQRYGAGSAALAAEMYDAIVDLSDVALPAAVPASVPTIGEVAKAVNGTLKTGNPEIVSSAVGRLVKMAGVDTTLQNAIRDRAQFAWIPHGDTCAFCIALAANGWQTASADTLKGGHAEHVHSNCDCTYAIRFSPKDEYMFYRPEKYRAMYDDAEGQSSTDKINAMRRAFYQKNKEEIAKQKKAAREIRKELNAPAVEEINVN